MNRSRLIALVGVPMIGMLPMTADGALLAVRQYGYDGLDQLTVFGSGELNGDNSHKSA
jgi:hypothetical protein